jgi:phenylacetate-coenzyme A ligase PaaK-like adenylate-forming protein
VHNVYGPDSLWRKAQETALRYPWYAGLLAEASARREMPPLLTAGILERYCYTAEPPDYASSLSAYKTSGTSAGIRKTIYYSMEDERRYVEIKARIFLRWLLQSSGAPIMRALSDVGTGHAAATAADVFRSIGLETESLPFDMPIEEHLDKLASFRPDVLYTMPSILDRILQAAASPDAFGIRKVILVGEIATPAWQKSAARRLGLSETDILDTVGSIEIGTIAAYSHELKRYVIAEGLYAECVPAEELGEGFEPLPPGEQVLVLTSFVRDAFPAVRYVTYDVVRDFETVSIGGEIRQTFSGIVKRIGPELKHGEKISLYDIEEAVLQHADDAAILVDMHDRRLTVRLRSRKLRPQQLPEVRQAIEHKIPEIGAMIRGGLLDGIEVKLAAENDPVWQRSGIKSRKIHYNRTQAP